jgi:hypothetical protein
MLEQRPRRQPSPKLSNPDELRTLELLFLLNTSDYDPFDAFFVPALRHVFPVTEMGIRTLKTLSHCDIIGQ